MKLDVGIHHGARGEMLEPSLSKRVIRMGRPPQRWFHHFVFVSAGRIDLVRDDEAIIGPAFVLLPPSDGETVAFAAGAHGYIVGVSPEIIGEAIGDHAESPSLRLFSDAFCLAGSLGRDQRRELEPLFQGFISELQHDDRASRMVTAAYIRLILMAAWRLSVAAGQISAPSRATGPILQRFRQSVEINFRQHWSIGHYAKELGISADRLHAICQKSLHRSPIELVHDRVVQEAKLRLERAAGSIRDVSDSLGFRDPTNFSHFFKRKSGISPAKYRSLATTASRDTALQTSSDYSDWP